MTRLTARIMAAHPGVTLRYNFGASGDLQKQIGWAVRRVGAC